MLRWVMMLSLLWGAGLGQIAFAHEEKGLVQAETAAETTPAPVLYERLGGVYAIAAVVDDFIERLLVNDTLNANPKISDARAKVPKAGLKFQVTALVCQVTGGPHMYEGRSMKDAHAHLDITDAEWTAMAEDFKKSLDTFNVPQSMQNELFAIVGTTKPDIVKAAEEADQR